MQIVVTINFGKLPPGKQKDETLDGNSFRTCCIKIHLNILSYVSYSDVSTVDAVLGVGARSTSCYIVAHDCSMHVSLFDIRLILVGVFVD